MRKVVLVLLVLLSLSLLAPAQKNELAITGGGYFPFGIDGVGSGGAIEGTFAHRVFNPEIAAVYVEVPVAVAFNVSQVSLLGQGKYSSLFVTPALKLKVIPTFFFSPWLSLGAGLARYNATQFTTATQSVSTHAVLQIGGGLDVKVLPYVSLRGEVRDFYSALPALPFLPGVGHQHNLLTTAGIVFRF